MILTAILTMVIVWCMFYTTIPNVYLAVLCLVLAGAFVKVGGHSHEGVLDIDNIAQRSKLNKINPALKFWSVLLLMFICVGSNVPQVGLVLAVTMLLLTVYGGGMHLHDYMALMATPLMFILISGVALLFDVGHAPYGVINIPMFGGYSFISKAAQLKTALVMSKALGSISCLYLLNLSTPMSEVIGVLKKSKTPGVVIELMYLIYRYTFVLFEMYRQMKDASRSRLGFADFRTSVRTTGQLYTYLLARSYRKAIQNFDAMESRCYTGDIQFLERKKQISLQHILAVTMLVIATLGMAALRL